MKTYQQDTCIDRSEVSRALAKAIAYKNCGNDRKAEDWARRLVQLLECSDILSEPKYNPYPSATD